MAFLQEYHSPFCTPHHREKVYRALCYMLIIIIFFGQEYDIRMEQDAITSGQSDITAHPLNPRHVLSFIFEIKAVARYVTNKGKWMLKSADRVERDLEKAKVEALTQMEKRRYRERAPLHTTGIHEYAFVFAGKFCVAAVRTLERDATSHWREVRVNSAAVSNCMVSDDMDDDMDDDVGDDDTDETM